MLADRFLIFFETVDFLFEKRGEFLVLLFFLFEEFEFDAKFKIFLFEDDVFLFEHDEFLGCYSQILL